jgi:ribose transport system permease protein
MGLTTVVASLAAVQLAATQTTWLLMVLVALGVGVAAGLLNGVVIAYGNVVAFIATLAMLVGARGLAELISGRSTQIVSQTGFLSFTRSAFLGVPTLIWIFVLVAALGWVLLNRTTFGRRTVAIGGNREAARLAGIKVKRHTVWLYVLSGLCSGIAGIMMLGRTTAGTSTHGTLYELDAIAAVVVGGTLLVGGRGTIVGTVLGVLIFNTLTNVFTQNNLDTSVQAVVKGAIIVIAVLLQQRFARRGARATG